VLPRQGPQWRRRLSPNFFLAQAHLLRESPARVWRKPTYDLFEQVTTHEVANDLRYCQSLVAPHEELLEEPPRR